MRPDLLVSLLQLFELPHLPHLSLFSEQQGKPLFAEHLADALNMLLLLWRLMVQEPGLPELPELPGLLELLLVDLREPSEVL